MKVHAGVDAGSRYVHTITGMSANMHDVSETSKLLREDDKSSVRCKVEHAFLIVKNQMNYGKVAYRGIEKSMNRFNVLFASANFLMCSRAGRIQEFLGCMA